ncbi:hypothetical protein [Reyranella sp.]|uniref:hypothetical protein n=1 Tax=Reyranella sp. TaxID=1929291 RepID=UPI003BABD43D
MNGDSFRDCFQFYNVAAIWSALNWLFHAGYEPKDVVGGSWGGVYCFLLAAIDSRVERIFSSFGCGGFVLPGIEKRNYWDFAIEHIGPDRFAAWCAAFDPILRMSDVGAEVYFETATNDKFFSLDMAMETWRRVRRQNFLSLAHNQDHRMGLNGLQPYRIQKLPSDSPVLAECRAASRKHLTWEVGSDTVLCWPLSPAEKALSRLVVSEQLPRHGNMSREWRTVEPMGGVAEAALFRIEPTHLDAGMLYYLDREVAVEGSPFKVATPVVGDTARSRALAGVVPALAHGRLLDAELETLLHAPVGDKMAPRIVADDRGWTLAFSGARRLRTMRFGVRPWLLPAGWSAVRLVLAGPTDDKTGRLHLILSTAYNTRAERAVGQRLSAVASVADGGKRIFHFRREAFAPFSLFDGRFGDGPPLGSMETVAGEFDAIGLADPEGGEPVEVSIVSIVVQ